VDIVAASKPLQQALAARATIVMVKRLPTPVLTDAGDMYESAAKIYPHEVDGRFQRMRRAAVFVLLGLFYFMPWIQWDGRQAVLFDLPARKFYILWLTFWPQDFFYLSMLLMMAAFSLFFFTALAGRLWCGYACPQTVWTETFLWIERWVEGSRNQRIKLDAAPASLSKFRRKLSKQTLWISFALWTGFTFVGFFTPVRQLAQHVLSLSAGPWEVFWMLFYAGATYGNAGYLREQVCKYMCPYARFQGAMFDRDTLIISYDAVRGEPRGARKKNIDPRSLALGDCTDCTVCVQVCPTGIDIRNGLQYECIACGACVDACDEVMNKMGYPTGLVRYTTQNSVEGKTVHIMRPRVIVYSVILTALLGGFLWSISNRMPLMVDVLRDRNALYRIASDQSIENAYTLKIMNKDNAPHVYLVSVNSEQVLALNALDSSVLKMPMSDQNIPSQMLRVSVEPQAVRELAVTLHATSGLVKGKNDIVFIVTDEANSAVSYQEKSRFFAPL
jgi:cytochrome c oxidase accessory protein FixG